MAGIRSAILDYIKSEGIRYKRINEKNLLLMKANSRYHYCMVEFFEMPQEWYDKQKYFNFKRILVGKSSKHVIIKLNEYLYEDTCREVNYGGESTQKQVS
jgi:hypothetical protein